MRIPGGLEYGIEGLAAAQHREGGADLHRSLVDAGLQHLAVLLGVQQRVVDQGSLAFPDQGQTEQQHQHRQQCRVNIEHPPDADRLETPLHMGGPPFLLSILAFLLI